MACDSPFRHYQSWDDGILYVHLASPPAVARAFTWDNSDIISSPVDEDFKTAFCQYNIPPPGSVLDWEKEWSNRDPPVSIQKGGTYCLRYL